MFNFVLGLIETTGLQCSEWFHSFGSPVNGQCMQCVDADVDTFVTPCAKWVNCATFQQETMIIINSLGYNDRKRHDSTTARLDWECLCTMSVDRFIKVFSVESFHLRGTPFFQIRVKQTIKKEACRTHSIARHISRSPSRPALWLAKPPVLQAVRKVM